MGRFLCLILLDIFFWNVENFLHPDGGKSAMIGKTVLFSGAPLVVGLAEVGDRNIVKSICYSDVLRKYNYSYIHFDSPDRRGIDVALMYRRDSLEVVCARPIPIKGLRTRDILYVCLKDSSGELWHFFVNHHPSKYSGASSEGKREIAMQTLVRSVDSLLQKGETRIVAMGDFNDTPDAAAFGLISGRLKNLGDSLLRAEGSSCGTIRYRGKWEIIDNFLVSEEVAKEMRMRILSPDFIMEKDKSFPGMKPKRTYIGPRYNGGVSDHLPILLY